MDVIEMAMAGLPWCVERLHLKRVLYRRYAAPNDGGSTPIGGGNEWYGTGVAFTAGEFPYDAGWRLVYERGKTESLF